MALKEQIFGRLDKICKPSTILGTNTSSLDIDRIAVATSRPEKVVGIHFFNPAHLQKTVEVVHGRYTSGEAVATAFEASKRMKKLPVLVKNCPAFLFNRLLSVYLQQVMRLMSLYGYLPQKIDSVFLNFGFSMGPVTLSDLNGIDVFERISTEHGWPTKDPLQTKMVELKRYGRKTGRGFYHYLPDTGKKVADKETEQIISKISSAANRSKLPRLLSDQDMIEYVLFPMVNEGLRCLDEEIIETAPQIDLMFIYGMDWPKNTGGPMRWAQSVGFDKIFNYIDNQYRMSNDDYWKPAQSLQRLAADRSRL
uniref:Uncharacterized protein n=1 Tax=Plectus sambesii TaxID=2011161 RepID=A0A914UWT0_9BILA